MRRFYLLVLLVLDACVEVCLQQYPNVLSIPCGVQSEHNPKWLWHVTINSADSDSENPACGGTLLNDRYVITAAHCLFDLEGNWIEASQLQVSYKTRDAIKHIYVSKSFYPNEFDVNTFDNDVALLKLLNPITFDDVTGAVCFELNASSETTGLLTIPIPDIRESEVDTVQLRITDYELCYGTNRFIFGTPYKHSICMGSLLRTDKFHYNRGSGIIMKKDGSWYLVGILLYTVGPTEKKRTYAGGINLAPYANWINQTINRHLHPTISAKKCEHYARIAQKPRGYNPTITLNDLKFSNRFCYGTLISERFILTAAMCFYHTERICMQYNFSQADFYTSYKFHFHPEDHFRQGIALVELDRNASHIGHFINCLWTDEDDPFEFSARLVRGTTILDRNTARVIYKPNAPVSVSIDDECSIFTVSTWSKPGDALVTQRYDQGIKRVIGLINKELKDCSPALVLNVVSYLRWIEKIAWGNKTAQ